MMRIANAVDFGDRVRGARDAYERSRSALEEARRQMVPAGTPTGVLGDVEDALEAHGRAYVDEVLGALNWQIGLVGWGQQNVIREAPVRSVGDRTVRFLDYLGCSIDFGDGLRPLLIVEAKRPGAPLFKAVSREARSVTLARALRDPQVFRGPWRDWIASLADYVRSIEQHLRCAPVRVVLTNGDWWVVFSDPRQAFLSKEAVLDSTIAVFEDIDDVAAQAEVYARLEHRRVQGCVRNLRVAEIPFYLRAQDVVSIMYGLRLTYSEVRQVHDENYPNVSVSPVVVLGLLHDGWTFVDGAKSVFRVPTQQDDEHGVTIESHLKNVDEAARSLMQDVKARLKLDMDARPVTSALRSPLETTSPTMVRYLGSQGYLILCGERTHFLRAVPDAVACGYHGIGQARVDGVAARLQILAPAIEPRALFVDGRAHHCAHGFVETAKAASVPSRAVGGLAPGEPFCPLWPIEQRLCCRTCVFEGVCSSSTLFHLPCQRV